MKKTATFINTARAEIVDMNELIRYANDTVYEEELEDGGNIISVKDISYILKIAELRRKAGTFADNLGAYGSPTSDSTLDNIYCFIVKFIKL